MAGGQLLLLLVGSIAGLALLLSLWLMGVSKRLSRELTSLRQQLSEQKEQSVEKLNFSNHLERIEREQQVVDVSRVPTDKYQYVASLAEQGFDANGIAAALQMAPAEVEQLLKLAQLKRQAQGH